MVQCDAVCCSHERRNICRAMHAHRRGWDIATIEALYCSVLQSVAVCCRVLQSVAETHTATFAGRCARTGVARTSLLLGCGWGRARSCAGARLFAGKSFVKVRTLPNLTYTLAVSWISRNFDNATSRAVSCLHASKTTKNSQKSASCQIYSIKWVVVLNFESFWQCTVNDCNLKQYNYK